MSNSPRHFDPVKFDAEAWAQLAQDAGMKYLIITSKHHDGFAMFGSKVDRFNIVDATPFKRDPMKELAEACAKRNIRFGFYYSQAPRLARAGGAIWKGPHENDPVYAVPQWDPKQNGDFGHLFQYQGPSPNSGTTGATTAPSGLSGLTHHSEL